MLLQYPDMIPPGIVALKKSSSKHLTKRSCLSRWNAPAFQPSHLAYRPVAHCPALGRLSDNETTAPWFVTPATSATTDANHSHDHNGVDSHTSDTPSDSICNKHESLERTHEVGDYLSAVFRSNHRVENGQPLVGWWRMRKRIRKPLFPTNTHVVCGQNHAPINP